MTNLSHWGSKAALYTLLGTMVFTAFSAQAKTPKPPGLFSNARGGPHAELPENAIARKSRAVKINRGQLRSGRFFLSLPGGVSLEAVRELQQELGQSRYAWVGHANGDRRNRVVIGVSGDAVAGTFAYKGKLFKLEPRKNGEHVLSEVETGDPAPELDPIPVTDITGSGVAVDGAIAADGGQTIDVLVAYTPRILSIYGANGADALIIQAVAEANQAYANSGINPRLNLVQSVLTNYTESGSMGTDLSRLRGNGDGYMDELHALRDSTGADLVSLLEDEPQYCGIAYLMSGLSSSFAGSAFSVVHRTCATGYYSFAHELGHNQGANHDPANASSAIYPYAFGHQDPLTTFRTVMAYNCPGGCTRVDHFSNPNVFFNGEPTGVEGLSDNARAINTTAATVASFRGQAAQNPPSAPNQLTAGATGHSTVSLNWQDTSADESGFNLERSDNGGTFAPIASLSANANSFLDDNLQPETVFNYRIQAWNSVGNSAYSTEAAAVTQAAPPFVEQLASADIPVAGSVSGTYQNTRTDDGSYQTITERQSGGKKRNRYSYLVHKWLFNVQPGNTIVLTADINTTTSNDSFTFAYSTDNSSFVEMFTVDAGNAGSQQFTLPPTLSGNLYIRVKDNGRTTGLTSSHSVRVDYLMVRSDNEVGDPPATPANLSAASASASQININWADMSDNEHGFALERSLDGSSNWQQIATASANATSYNDSGLAASTTYHYRVHAFNGAGSSAASNSGSSRTDEAPTTPVPPTTENINLEASGYKVKGKQKAKLNWSGTQSNAVDVYRDGSMVTNGTANDGNYTDHINNKGGGSYSYVVCETGTEVCSTAAGVAF